MKKRFLLKLFTIFVGISISTYAMGNSKLTAKVSANSTGRGKVYASAGKDYVVKDEDYGVTAAASYKGDSYNEKHTFYAYAKANGDYVFKGWAKTDNSTSDLIENNPYEVVVTGNNNTNKYNETTLYAVFGQPPLIIYKAPVDGGTYTATYPDEAISMSPGGDNVTKTSSKEVLLSATPNTGYKFLRWVKVVNDVSSGFAYTPSTSKNFAEDAEIYAEFIPEDWAVFRVNDAFFGDLNEANRYAASNGNIIVEQGGNLAAGSYTISAGVTLLIPYYDQQETWSELPKEETTWKAQFQYRKLTMMPGATIDVQGNLCVAAEQYGTSSGNPGPGAVCGPYGCIDMSAGGEIIIQKNAALYAQGFILGKGDQSNSGTITIKNGGCVYENIVVLDMHGGGGTAATVNGTSASNDYGLFPFHQYYIQNIEPKMTIEYGGTQKVAYDVVASGGIGKQDYASLIGSDDKNLFTMQSGCSITKWYNASRDYQCYALDGEFSLNELSINISSSIGLNSSKFILPITNNMDITILKGGVGKLDKPIKLLPGAKLSIENDAEMQLNSDLYVYDCNEWDLYSLDAFVRTMSTKTSPGIKISRSNTQKGMGNASLIVDGTVSVGNNGNIYTTTTGASVVSNGKGTITYTASIPSSSQGKTLYEIYGTYGKKSDGKPLNQGETEAEPKQVQVGKYSYFLIKNYYTYGTPIETTPAQLRHADGTYLATAGVPANTTINYRNGHWGWLTKWIDVDGKILKQVIAIEEQESTGYTYDHSTIPSDREWNSWKVIRDDDNQEVSYIAQFKEKDAVGPLLDIVDWKTTDDGKTVMIVNFNGVPASIWPLKIKVGEADEVQYERTDRNADRTMDIPYSEGSNSDLKQNDDLKIKVTAKDGTTYSQHSYVIPQVYEVDATLSDVRQDGHSIIFVRKGKLTVNQDATIGAIYVAPGAELEIGSGATLTVDSLMLRTTPWEAAILTNNGTINAKAYYTRIVRSNSQYYQFALPLAFDVNAVHLSNYANIKYGITWLLKRYSEQNRATQGAGGEDEWQYLKTGGTTACAGYEMFSNTGSYYCEYYFPVTLPTSITTDLAVTCTTNNPPKVSDEGWNALCSPLLGKYTQKFATPSQAIKVSRLTESGNYYQCIPAEIYPAVPFYYQAPKGGTLDFSGNELILKAPQRAWNTSVSEQWLRLTIHNAAGTMCDETNIFVHPEKFSADYEPGYDVAKQSLTASTAVLYSAWPCGPLAFAAIPDSVAADRIPLTVGAGKAGEYTFSLQDNNYLERLDHVFLYDAETGAVTDLLGDDYTIALPQGTAAGRFYIRCVFAPVSDITTDIVPAGTEDMQTNHVQKFLYNDRVYILRNGVFYDLTGRPCELQ